ncbi:MAG: hypothetical protein R2742_10920 [Micropruina glycogenica]
MRGTAHWLFVDVTWLPAWRLSRWARVGPALMVLVAAHRLAVAAVGGARCRHLIAGVVATLTR